MRLLLWLAGLFVAVKADGIPMVCFKRTIICFFPETNSSDTTMSGLIQFLPGTVSKIGCLNEFSVCSYEIQCESEDSNWSTEAFVRNPEAVHHYICEAGVYTDVVTNKTFEDLVESCEPHENDRPGTDTPKTNVSECVEDIFEEGLENFYYSDTTPRVYELKCEKGYVWNPELPIRNNALIRKYRCTNGIYTNVLTGQMFDKLADRCDRAETKCPLTVNDSYVEASSNVVVRRNCSLDPYKNEQTCVFEIKCAPFDETGNVHTYKSVQKGDYLCNEDNGKWVNIQDNNMEYDPSRTKMQANITVCSSKASTLTKKAFNTKDLESSKTPESPCGEDIITETQSSTYYLHICTAQPAKSIKNCTTTVYCNPMDKNTFTSRTSQRHYKGLAICDPLTRQWSGYPTNLNEDDPEKMLKELCGIEENATTAKTEAASTSTTTTKKITTTTLKPTTTPVVLEKECLEPEKHASISILGTTFSGQRKMNGITLKCTADMAKNVSIEHRLECDRSIGKWKNTADNITYQNPREICEAAEKKSLPVLIKDNPFSTKKSELACDRNITLPHGKIEEICSAQMCLYQLECEKDYTWGKVSNEKEKKRFYACLGNNTYREQKTKNIVTKIDEICVPVRSQPSINDDRMFLSSYNKSLLKRIKHN